MKTTNWENAETSLELKSGDQPANLHTSRLEHLLGDFITFPRAFPELANWNKIPACKQKSDESVHDFTINFRL